MELEIGLLNKTGKILRSGLLNISSSIPDIIHFLKNMERLLSLVDQGPSEAILDAMHPIIDGMIAKNLMTHINMDVNILVASCICEILSIMVSDPPYNDQQMKAFFELVVMTFEKLSAASGGCYSKMKKVLVTLGRLRLAALMLNLHLEALVVRLFRQFLTVADSNATDTVLEMEKVMTTIIEDSDEDAFELIAELSDLLVTCVEKENQLASPACYQLAEKVIKNCADKLKLHLPNMEDKETIQSTSETSKLRKDTTLTMKIINSQVEKKTVSSDDPPVASKSVTEVNGKCNRNNTPLKKQEDKGTVQPTSEASKFRKDTTRTMKLRKHEKKTLSSEDPPISSKSVTDVNGKRKINSTPSEEQVQVLQRSVVSDDPPMASESETEVKEKRKRNNTPLKERAQSVKHAEKLVGRTILVWWPKNKEYKQGVVNYFDCITNKHKVFYDDGDEELLDLECKQWALVENASAMSDSVKKSSLRCVQGYIMKNSIAPTLEAIFKKHGDIASECLFKTASTREFHLELVCEVVRQIQRNDVIDIQEIECKLSDAEAAKLDVSWIRAHLEAIHKRKEMMLNSALLRETQKNTNLVKEAAETDLKERRAELVAAQQRFKKAENCVKVLELIENKLNHDILVSNAEKVARVKQSIL